MSTHVELIAFMSREGNAPAGAIVEVGSQRALGKGSSFRLREFSTSVGNPFYTVDADQGVYEKARQAVGDAATHARGEDFLATFSGKIAALYLDNYDIIYSPRHAIDLRQRIGDRYEVTLDYDFGNAIVQNYNSSIVHLRQLEQAYPKLTEKCLVAVDDTKLVKSGAHHYWWGKGNTVVPLLLQSGFQLACEGEKGVVLTRGF